MTDWSEATSAAAALADPSTSAADLGAIARAQPPLWGAIARHANVYPKLLDWLDEHGDESVKQAVAERREHPTTAASVQPQESAGAPPASDSPPTAPSRGGKRGLATSQAGAAASAPAGSPPARAARSAPSAVADEPASHPARQVTPTPVVVGPPVAPASRSRAAVPGAVAVPGAPVRPYDAAPFVAGPVRAVTTAAPVAPYTAPPPAAWATAPAGPSPTAPHAPQPRPAKARRTRQVSPGIDDRTAPPKPAYGWLIGVAVLLVLAIVGSVLILVLP